MSSVVALEPCPVCRGTGEVQYVHDPSPHNPTPFVTAPQPCHRCKGTGLDRTDVDHE